MSPALGNPAERAVRRTAVFAKSVAHVLCVRMMGVPLSQTRCPAHQETASKKGVRMTDYRRSSLIAMLLAALLVLAGCSGEDGEPGTDGNLGTTQQAAT